MRTVPLALVLLLFVVGCAAPAPAAAPPVPLPATAPTSVATAPPPAAVAATAAPPRATTAPLASPTRAPTVAASSAAASVTPTAASNVKLAQRFNGERAYRVALDQCSIGPRPAGSPAIQKTRDYIINALKDSGWQVDLEKFTHQGVEAVNIVGRKGQGPVTILGAHYDTRPIADKDPDLANRQKPILGGNDGASGVAVLLELARVWADKPPPGETWLTFFDVEDMGDMPGWEWGVGSAYMAQNLKVTPKQMILVDMIGDADQQIYLEKTSTQPLLNRIFDVAHELGYDQWFIRQPKWAISDDHTPFLQRGIPAVDLIDFDYPYHHTLADDCTKITPASLERVGRTLELFMNRGG